MPDDVPNAPPTPPAGAVADPAAPPAPVAPVAPVVGDPPAPAAPVAPAVPEVPKAPDAPKAGDAPTYTLALPKDSGLDPAVVEKTAAIASALGLSQDHAQKALEFVSQEAAAHAKAVVAADLESRLPGGAVWTQQNADWTAAALKDPDLGAGKPEQLEATVTLAKQVLAKFGAPETLQFLEQTGLGSHPATLKLLATIGKAMREDQLVLPAGGGSQGKDAANMLYGGTAQ